MSETSSSSPNIFFSDVNQPDRVLHFGSFTIAKSSSLREDFVASYPRRHTQHQPHEPPHQDDRATPPLRYLLLMTLLSTKHSRGRSDQPKGRSPFISLSLPFPVLLFFFILNDILLPPSTQPSATLTMSKFEPLKWGILATGGIAETFARDLFPSPSTRGVNDISHVVVAAASSSSADRAQEFLKEVRAPDSAKAYGSYKELVNDPNVDCIYIATPHSHHYQNCRLALEAGKNVLCEKAFTTNAKQLEVLITIAREKKLFLMEAVSILDTLLQLLC